MEDDDDAYFTDIAKLEPFRLGHVMKAIDIEEKMRGQGIAIKMILYLIEHARRKKVSEIYLEVLAKNKVALKLYKKLYFKERLFTGIISEGLYGLYYPITTQECGD
ncbi:MAG: GNAT family N-acetyltransferase [Bacteroidota bacterium]